MIRLLTASVLLGLAVANSVCADPSMPASSMTHKQALHDCMEQQKTANMSMSNAQLKRLCKDKMKTQKATGDMPEQPAADVPHN